MDDAVAVQVVQPLGNTACEEDRFFGCQAARLGQ
jgi:hypothetical protein